MNPIKIEVLKTIIAGAVLVSCGAAWNFIFEYKNLQTRVEELENNIMEFHVENENCLLIEHKNKYYCLELWEVIENEN